MRKITHQEVIRMLDGKIFVKRKKSGNQLGIQYKYIYIWFQEGKESSII